MKNKILIILLAIALMLSACSAPDKDDKDQNNSEQNNQNIETGIESINKYGNIFLTIEPASMTEAGYEPADIVLVKIGDTQMEMPIGTSYSDADSGEPICCFRYDDSKKKDVVVLAINYGSMAETLGIAEKKETDTDPGYEWTFADGIDESVTVYISMEEKQGYADEYALHQLGNTRSNKRSDYANLTDAEFANFRAVETTGMGKGILYRSSNPVNPVLNRSVEADKALLDAGVKTVMNTSDNEAVMTRYPDYALTAYSQCDIIALDMSLDFNSDEAKAKLAEGFSFLASHEGPYLIHCIEGKDRTGFAVAILECLMGAGADEIIDDYMLTFYNFYGIGPDSEQYDQIAESNIGSILSKAFGISSIREEGVDLQKCAEDYLKDIGLKDSTISTLKEKLAGN